MPLHCTLTGTESQSSLGMLLASISPEYGCELQDGAAPSRENMESYLNWQRPAKYQK